MRLLLFVGMTLLVVNTAESQQQRRPQRPPDNTKRQEAADYQQSPNPPVVVNVNVPPSDNQARDPQQKPEASIELERQANEINDRIRGATYVIAALTGVGIVVAVFQLLNLWDAANQQGY